MVSPFETLTPEIVEANASPDALRSSHLLQAFLMEIPFKPYLRDSTNGSESGRLSVAISSAESTQALLFPSAADTLAGSPWVAAL